MSRPFSASNVNKLISWFTPFNSALLTVALGCLVFSQRILVADHDIIRSQALMECGWRPSLLRGEGVPINASSFPTESGDYEWIPALFLISVAMMSVCIFTLGRIKEIFTNTWAAIVMQLMFFLGAFVSAGLAAMFSVNFSTSSTCLPFSLNDASKVSEWTINNSPH